MPLKLHIYVGGGIYILFTLRNSIIFKLRANCSNISVIRHQLKFFWRHILFNVVESECKKQRKRSMTQALRLATWRYYKSLYYQPPDVTLDAQMSIVSPFAFTFRSAGGE